MRSKEALERLKEETQPNAYTLNHNDKDFDTIEKDLERLEVLEKVIEILKSYVDIHKNCITFDTITCFEKQKYELLKEALKND